MRIIFTAVLCVSTLLGAQSVVLPNGNFGTVTITGLANGAAIRIEGRVDARTYTSGSFDAVFAIGGLALNVTAQSTLTLSAATGDAYAGGTPPSITTLGSIADLHYRVMRTGSTVSLETWESDGTDYTASTKTITTVGSPAWTSLVIGGASGASTVAQQQAFIRVYSTALPVGSAMPNEGVDAPADVVGYPFEGNFTDESGNGRTITWTGGTPSFATTVGYAPVCDPGGELQADVSHESKVRAGVVNTLNGSGSRPMDGGSTLTYLWRQTGGPNTVHFSHRQSSSPTVTNVVTTIGAGTDYTFQLRVSQGDGQSSTCSVTWGAVVSDDNGVVVTGNATLDKMLGPLMRIDSIPWSATKSSAEFLSEYYAARYGVEIKDSWNINDFTGVTETGTINVTNGSATVTTSDGANLQAVFCDGTTTKRDSQATYLVVWRPGIPSPAALLVASCPSANTLTLASNATFTVTEAAYGYAGNLEAFYWVNGGTNVNYYDAVLAHYKLYFATGLIKYKTRAEWLASRWITSPFRGLPRTNSMRGITVYYLVTGSSSALTWLEYYWNEAYVFLGIFPGNHGERENGYYMDQLSQCGIAAQDATLKSNCKSRLNTWITSTWVPSIDSNGVWTTSQCSIGANCWTSGAYVTNGSSTVTSPTNAFTTSHFVGEDRPTHQWLFFTSTVADGGMDTYRAVRVSDSELTLTDNAGTPKPYTGATNNTGAGAGWHHSNLVGAGTQPFIMGVVAEAFGLAYDAQLADYPSTSATIAGTVLPGIRTYLAGPAYDASRKGVYYGTDYPNCSPPSEDINCSAATTSGTRTLNVEALNAHTRLYMLTGDSTVRTNGDVLYGAAFGGTGETGPEVDATAGDSLQSTLGDKWLGYHCGFGPCLNWPAARLGGLASSDSRSVPVDLGTGWPAACASYRVTRTAADGSTAQFTSATTSVSVTVQGRDGGASYTGECLNAGAAVIRSAPLPNPMIL
jgi:hypothetical protein